MSQLASEPNTLPASQPVSQLASQPASQSSESVSPVSQSVSQPTDQPTITLVHGSHEQPIEQTTQTVKAKTNQLTSQPTNRGADLPNYSQNKRLRPPVPRILHREGGKGRKEGENGSLNQLKIGYDEVETPKLPRPCTLACICKIIWVSDSGQVGEWSSKFRNHTGREAFEKIVLNFIF